MKCKTVLVLSLCVIPTFFSDQFETSGQLCPWMWTTDTLKYQCERALLSKVSVKKSVDNNSGVVLYSLTGCTLQSLTLVNWFTLACYVWVIELDQCKKCMAYNFEQEFI